jgi:triacylglycerol lipase
MSTDPQRRTHDLPDLTPKQSEKIPTWRAAYSDRTSALMAAFCEFAYLPFEIAPPPPAPGAPKNERPSGHEELQARLKAGEFRLVKVFNKDDTQAFLAVRDTEFAVLAFRGTTTLEDWRTNLRVRRVPLPDVPDVKVHCGFLQAFECCKDEIKAAVHDNVPDDLGLYITGHSLGGALAQIASAVLERPNLAACYTFGSPRVGTSDFDRQVKCPHYRLINNWDLVPSVPPPMYRGYYHTGDPRLLTPSAHGQEALRRDRRLLVSLAVDLWALARWAISRKLLVVDDHMIWNYRTQLEDIANYRSGGPQGTGLTR